MKQKSIIIAMLALCLALFAGCASGTASSTSSSGSDAGASSEAATSAEPETTKASAGAFTPGTYTAIAAGRNGEVVVTAEFSEDAITAITTESEETETIGGAAIDQLTEQVLASQALGLDAISGATLSSEAFLAALADCVTQAGGDPAALTGGASAAAAAEYVTEADVIVVGAGGAGISAALTAGEAGANVVLLEKSGVVGGNTLMTMNGINSVDSQLQLDNEDYVNEAPEGGFKELTMGLADQADEAMVDAYVANSGETIDWIASKGVDFEVTFSEDHRNNAMNYWLMMGGGPFETAPNVINALNNSLKQLDNVHLYVNTEVTSLLTNDAGEVVGVVATTPNGEMEFSAASVILCTGGFNANKEMVVQYRPDLENAVIGVHAPTTGDGLRMAEEVGAATMNLETMNTYPNYMEGYGMVKNTMIPGGMDAIDCIYVDQDGKRFCAEGFRADVDAVLSNTKSFTILDASGMNEGLQPALEAGYIKQADTIEDLATQLGLDPAALAATVEEFNADIADGTDDAFGREGSAEPLEAPFYGYQFGVATHYDLGGLVTNEKTQVLTEDGSVIPNLYAAGEVVGSFQGNFRVDGSGIGESFVFGRIAGKEAAALG